MVRLPDRLGHIPVFDSYYAWNYSSVMDVTDNWTTQLRKGVLELCVLNVVGQAPVYGYDIVKRLRGIDALVIREGTVYPILSRLKRDGLVITSLQESPEGRPGSTTSSPPGASWCAGR